MAGNRHSLRDGRHRAELEQRCAPPLPPTTGRAAPLPCARCNPAVRIPALTGRPHRGGNIRRLRPCGKRVLKKRACLANDQSFYMLARLTPDQFSAGWYFRLGAL
ncbi:MAG: hypothetical protein ACLRWQ_11015 [Flavonifractor plautii]